MFQKLVSTAEEETLYCFLANLPNTLMWIITLVQKWSQLLVGMLAMVDFLSNKMGRSALKVGAVSYSVKDSAGVPNV